MANGMNALKGFINSPYFKILAYPLKELKDCLNDIFIEQDDLARTSTRASFIVAGLIVGGLLPYTLWPAYGQWLLQGAAHWGLPNWFANVFIVYVGGWSMASPLAWSVKHIGRAITNCIFGDPDYFLTNNQANELAEKFGESPERVHEMFDFCVEQIRGSTNARGARNEDFIETIKAIKEGDFDAYYEHYDLLLNKKAELERKRQEIAEKQQKLDELLALRKALQEQPEQEQLETEDIFVTAPTSPSSTNDVGTQVKLSDSEYSSVLGDEVITPRLAEAAPATLDAAGVLTLAEIEHSRLDSEPSSTTTRLSLTEREKAVAREVLFHFRNII